MTTHVPWLTLIVPTRDGARYLGAALASVVAQGERDLEVLLVDDGSTDDTLRIARQFACQIPLRIIERRVGNWAANTNLGMQLAQGEYIAWLHQDDVWLANRVARLRELAHQFPEAQLLIHPVWFIDGHAVRRGVWKFPIPLDQQTLLSADAAARDVAGSLLIQNWIATPATLFRADAARRVGYLDEQLWYSADWDFWLKLALTGPVALSPDPLACFRIHADSQTLARGPADDNLRWQYARVLRRHLPGWQRQYPQRTEVAQAAQFSAELNLALRQLFFVRPPRLGRLFKQMVRMSTRSWAAYLRHSTLSARCLSRLCARLAGPGRPPNGSRNAHVPPVPALDCDPPDWTDFPAGQRRGSSSSAAPGGPFMERPR
jgi:glycosyltransferase involved in cell wall biosynthesis